jgi:hypothetical protein
MVNKAEIIMVPDLLIASPTVGINKPMEEYDGSAKFSPDEDHFTNRGGAGASVRARSVRRGEHGTGPR